MVMAGVGSDSLQTQCSSCLHERLEEIYVQEEVNPGYVHPQIAHTDFEEFP